nr:hypothetical protein Iba_chr14bCG2020 [Ipomoea batatas]
MLNVVLPCSCNRIYQAVHDASSGQMNYYIDSRTALISSSVTGPVEGVEAVFADDDDAPLVALFFAADGTSSFTDFAS